MSKSNSIIDLRCEIRSALRRDTTKFGNEFMPVVRARRFCLQVDALPFCTFLISLTLNLVTISRENFNDLKSYPNIYETTNKTNCVLHLFNWLTSCICLFAIFYYCRHLAKIFIKNYCIAINLQKEKYIFYCIGPLPDLIKFIIICSVFEAIKAENRLREGASKCTKT